MKISNQGGYKTRETLLQAYNESLVTIENKDHEIAVLQSRIQSLKDDVNTEKTRTEMYQAWYREGESKIQVLQAKLVTAKVLLAVSNGETIDNPANLIS